jgi:putative transposase
LPNPGGWTRPTLKPKANGFISTAPLLMANFGGIIDFMLSQQRDESAAKAFFKQSIDNPGLALKVVITKAAQTTRVPRTLS